uniref:acid phosphatase n=2 Tax=Ursus TaxID=9639 RepID=A0A452TJX9_URSMA
MAEQVPTSALLLCLGNTCQSLIAEAIFRKLVTDQNVLDNWRVDSAATSMREVENPPDYQRHNCMKEHGTPMNHIVQVRGSSLSLCVLTDPGAPVGGLNAWRAPGICESQSIFSVAVVS